MQNICSVSERTQFNYVIKLIMIQVAGSAAGSKRPGLLPVKSILVKTVKPQHGTSFFLLVLPLWKSTNRWENSIKMDHREIRSEFVKWIVLTQDRVHGFCEHSSEPFSFIKGIEFLNHLTTNFGTKTLHHTVNSLI